MSTCKRYGKKWSTSEVLALQREYELLNWSVQQIAEKHQRSVQSILYKLLAEGLTSSLHGATGYTTEVNSPVAKVSAKTRVVEDEDEESDTDSSSDFNDNDESDDDEEYIDKNVNTLSDRVWNLETHVGEIKTMVKEMFDKMSNQKNTKRLAPLGIHL
jgi:hypothetical protein